MAHDHPDPAEATLRHLGNLRGLRVGTAIRASTLGGNAPYGAIAAREFGSITPANEMKWASVEPDRGEFDWSGADATIAFARAHDQVVRGHTLVWHRQVPDWLTSAGLTGPQILQVMTEHVVTEAGRYAGEIAAWDVVNEPFNEDGTFRTSIFEQASNGPGYIATALHAARRADPAARLYLNDYNIEGINAKSTAMLNLATSLRRQGVPIDGIGIQGHVILGQVPSDLAENVARFAAAGFEVCVTEIDVRIPLADGQPTPAQLAEQAADYAKIVEACLAVRGCVGITVWGFTDLDSWIPRAFSGYGAAGLLDASLRPKPAYVAMQRALAAAPSLRAAGEKEIRG
jgi:endo-1,4-beta-xylanase